MSDTLHDFIRKIIGPTDEEFDRNARINRLATYNAERLRGLLHTDEWNEFMSAEQVWFNAWRDSTPPGAK